ncbi:MAG: DUF87 domain-containing protein [Clostridia bacterium]|nr:DUF87 domain-containing protein [Clostridia bacterium]
MRNRKRDSNNVPSPRRPDRALDKMLPGAVRFFPDHYLLGDSFRCALTVREFPLSCTETGLLHRIGEYPGVTVHIFIRRLEAAQERKCLQDAARRNRWLRSSNDPGTAVAGEESLSDTERMARQLVRNRDKLVSLSVFFELRSDSLSSLHALKEQMRAEFLRLRIAPDWLTLRQKEGFLSVMPGGKNMFGREFEHVMPALSAANLYPMTRSGLYDEKGFSLGHGASGAPVRLDPDARDVDRTNSSVLILGNSGMGKSYLLKLLIVNLRLSGKNLYVLDAEEEYGAVCRALGGTYVRPGEDGQVLNPFFLQPLPGEDPDAAVREHCGALRDFFSSYYDFSQTELDEIVRLSRSLYEGKDITSSDYPTLSDLGKKLENLAAGQADSAYPGILSALRPLISGPDAAFFNGKGSDPGTGVCVLGVSRLLCASKRTVRAGMWLLLRLFERAMLRRGNTVLCLDELYLFLSDPDNLLRIRDLMKRARKRDSGLVIASQNIEDFTSPALRDAAKPLFSIPAYRFLFFPGQVDDEEYKKLLDLDESESGLIRGCRRGECYLRAGSVRDLLHVHAPEYIRALCETGGR